MITTIERGACRVRAHVAAIAPVAVLLLGLAPTAGAAPLLDTLTDTRVALGWPLALAVALLVAGAAAIIFRRQALCAQQEAESVAGRLRAENSQLQRQLRSHGSQLKKCEGQLSETRDSVELLRQERSDLHGTLSERLQRPLEAVQGTLSLLLRGGDPESAGLAEMAQRQLRAATQALQQLQLRGSTDNPPPAPARASGPEASNLAVLLVENEGQDSLRGPLERLGHRVVRATNGIDGVDIALREKFDLVLLDCDLRLLDCVEVTRKIRRDAGRELPIFALVNALFGGEKERYQAEGLTGVLARPVMEAQLHQLLNWVARRARRQPPAATKSRTPTRMLNTTALERQRDMLGTLAFSELLANRIATLPKRITALTSALTGRHWPDAERRARAAAANSEEVGLEAIASRLRTLAESLAVDSEREFCRHQRTEILNLMRSSIQQLKAWRDRNVHTAWALK